MRNVALLMGIVANFGGLAVPSSPQEAREFKVASRDGTPITGQADVPAGHPRVAVVMVAGTGLFDRDVIFGKSATEADKLFKALGERFVQRGLIAVRYDRRGVRFGQAGPGRLDLAVAGSSTVESQRDDLDAVYQWARARSGLGAKCVILFGHSEGTLHIARLAASGAPEPLGVIGIGVVATSPKAVIHWQIGERDAFSLRMMDVDHDGRTTADEVRAHWRETPSSAFDALAPLLPPDGVAWTREQLAQVKSVQGTLYEQATAAALKLDDAAPYPNAVTPMARSSWWKSWFTDDVPAAQSLTKWPHSAISFHWGEIDSQTPPSLNEPVAREWLGRRASLVIHPGLGHSLGAHALYGPMSPAVAETIADEAARIAKNCK